MTNVGTHLIETSRVKPSLFDFVAQDSLDQLLHPAFKKLVDFVAERDERLRPLAKRYDELFCICNVLLQFQYLRHHGGTFTERYYDLVRVPIARSQAGGGGGGLGTKEIFLSLLFSVIGPYARRKLNAIVDDIYFNILPSQSEGRRKTFLRGMVALARVLNISVTTLSFAHYLRYLAGKSEFASPSLWASGLRLDYAPADDSRAFGLRNLLPSLLRRGLGLTSFFVQFCQRWSNERLNAFGALPIPPPPEVSKAGKEFSGICPLCRKKRVVDTVVRTSGFIYCLVCILNHVEENGSCPVTHLPARVDDLTTLYITRD